MVATQLKRATLPTMDPRGIQPKLHLPSLQVKVMVQANNLAQMLPTIHHKLSQVMACPQPPNQQLMVVNLQHNLVMDLAMDPLRPKSLVACRLCMDNPNHLTQQEAMVNLVICNLDIPLLSPHLLEDMPNQSQVLKKLHHLVMVVQCSQGMVPRHMVVPQQVVNLVMARLLHRTATVLMVLLVTLSLQYIPAMVM